MKTLADLGERTAVQLIIHLLSKKPETVVDVGDDCAVFDFEGDYLLVSTDMISASTHIPQGMTPWQIGWFIAAINFSDIAAKGGRLLGIVLALGLPEKTTDDFLISLIKGADACAQTYETFIVGGDTKKNPELTLCGTVFGLVQKSKFMSRKGAQPGDIVAVTGTLGKAGAGYLALREGIADKKFTKGLFEPIPRLPEGRILAGLGGVHSCMDISDGLSSSLHQLQKINNTGFEIQKEKIPIDTTLQELAAESKTIDVFEYAVHFGGDYELLLTLSQDQFNLAKQKIEAFGTSLTAIGKVKKDIAVTVTSGGINKPLPDKGYNHFKASSVL